MKKHKKLPVLFIILVVIAAGALVWLNKKTSQSPSSQTPGTNQVAEDPTTKDWKTYSNSEYGFQFKYPIDLTLLGSFHPEYSEFEVCVLPSPNGQYCDRQSYDYQQNDYKKTVSVRVMERTKENEANLNQNWNFTDYTFVVAKNDSFLFGFSGHKDNAELINKIQKTFKAIPIQNSVTQEWKTYTNTEDGFTFRYPAYYGDFQKVEDNKFRATNKPLPSKTATLEVTVHDGTSGVLFSGIGYGDQVQFDVAKTQFYTAEGNGPRTYVEKKFTSNGDLYMNTSSGEGADGAWGFERVFIVYDKTHRQFVKLETVNNNSTTYNRGVKLDAIFSTFSFVR